MSDLTANLAQLLTTAKDSISNQYQQGKPIRQGLAKILNGDISPLNDIYGQVKQLGNPSYMKQVNSTSGADMMDVALNTNPIMAGTIKALTPFEMAHATAQKNAVDMLGLNANNTAMERAKAMGFDDKTYYHGTNADIKKFDPEMSAQGGITWIADTPKYANDYTMNSSQGAGNIIPLKANMGKSAGWKEYDQLGLDELSGRGYKSTWLPESNGESVGFVMNPNQLRSTHAAFDPAKSQSSDLLGFADPRLLSGIAGVTGGGLLGAHYVKDNK